MLLPAVNSKGAVSPAMRAMPRNTPVTIAVAAAGRMTRMMVWAGVAPRA